MISISNLRSHSATTCNIAAVLFVTVAVSLVSASNLRAHPPVSIVIASDGTVFYSDLERVWMILPDGTRKVAVNNVHTHELRLDSADNLFGEDVTNIGENYRHRVWKRSSTGVITNVIPWRSGYPDDFSDYGFTVDSAGRQYSLNRQERLVNIIGKQKLPFSLQEIQGHIHWLAMTNNDDLLLGIGSSVFVRNGSELTELAPRLIERTTQFSFVHDRHAMMGLWSDDDGNVFSAIFSGQVVKKISRDGTVETIYRSEGKWSPTGGVIGQNGAQWILEFSSSNQVRVTRVDKDGRIERYE